MEIVSVIAYLLKENGTTLPLAVFDRLPDPTELRNSYHPSSLGWLVYLTGDLHRYPMNRRPLNSTLMELDEFPIWQLLGAALEDYDSKLARFFCSLSASDWKRLDGWSFEECRNWMRAEWSTVLNMHTLLHWVVDVALLPADIRARLDAAEGALWQRVEQEREERETHGSSRPCNRCRAGATASNGGCR